jgi:hypothetical protein
VCLRSVKIGNRRELAAINPLLKNSPGKYQKYQLEGRLRENTTLKPKKGPTMGNWASKGEDVKLCESRRWHLKNALNVFLRFAARRGTYAPSDHEKGHRAIEPIVQLSGFMSDGLGIVRHGVFEGFHELPIWDRPRENTGFQTPDSLNEGVVGFSMAKSAGQPNQSASKNEHDAYQCHP